MTTVTELNPFFRGDDFALQVTLKNKADQSPVDITGWCLSSTMKLSSELPDYPQMDSKGNRQVLQVIHQVPDSDDAKNGIARLLFPHDQTQTLIPTTYQLDIQAEAGDSVMTLMKGLVRVNADVTRDTFDVIPAFNDSKTAYTPVNEYV